MNLLRTLTLLLLLGLGSCATIAAPPATRPAEPGFVIAANPLAAQAGMDVLKRGGSAVDAAIAVQAMLSLGRAAKLGPRRRGVHDLLRRQVARSDGL